MEMQTAAREGVKVTAVIVADGQLSMERINATERWGHTLGITIGPIRWDKIAEGMGCHGVFVETLPELISALTRAKQGDCPTLIQVKTDADANTFSLPPDLKTRFLEVYLGPGKTRFE